MNYLAKILGSDNYIIQYPNIVDVEYDERGKPKQSWMKDWTQEERTEKFFEFCREYDLRRDSLLRDNYQQFSHRLHWHECPFVDEVKEILNSQIVLEACLIFSFTNEHWQTFRTWRSGGADAMRHRFLIERHARSDLFQIYYPKNTNVKEWLCNVPKDFVEKNSKKIFTSRNRPYTMMELAKILNEIFVKDYGFRNAMYPCKNAARHIAMSHPEWADPDSFLHGGTGYFDGLSQLFNCPNLMSKSKYKIDEYGEYIALNDAAKMQVEHMNYLKTHSSNPIHTHQYLNLEDKLCFFYKHIAITQGVKPTTKQILYDWVYPNNWSLKTGKYDVTQ